VAAHLQEAPIVDALLADADRVHCRLHVVVDSAPASALEEGEGPVVRVEHHLQRLAGIEAHEQHPAVTQPHIRGLHRDSGAIQHDDLVAPVELIGFPWGEAQRDEDCGRRVPAGLAPASRRAAIRRAISPSRVVSVRHAGLVPIKVGWLLKQVPSL